MPAQSKYSVNVGHYDYFHHHSCRHDHLTIYCWHRISLPEFAFVFMMALASSSRFGLLLANKKRTEADLMRKWCIEAKCRPNDVTAHYANRSIAAIQIEKRTGRTESSPAHGHPQVWQTRKEIYSYWSVPNHGKRQFDFSQAASPFPSSYCCHLELH